MPPLRQLSEDELHAIEQQRVSVQKRLEALEAKAGVKGDGSDAPDWGVRLDAVEKRLDDLEGAVNRIDDALTDRDTNATGGEATTVPPGPF
jgi:hypothetical protein